MREVFGIEARHRLVGQDAPSAAGPARGRCRRAAARRPRACRRATSALCVSSTRRGTASAISTSASGNSCSAESIDDRSAMRPTSTFFSTDRRCTRLWCWKIIATSRRTRRRSRRAGAKRVPSTTISPAVGCGQPVDAAQQRRLAGARSDRARRGTRRAGSTGRCPSAPDCRRRTSSGPRILIMTSCRLWRSLHLLRSRLSELGRVANDVVGRVVGLHEAVELALVGPGDVLDVQERGLDLAP